MNVRNGIDVLRETYAEWQADHAPTLGAALAYYSVFSIGPLLLIAIATAGLFLGREAVQGEVFRQLQSVLGAEGARAVELLLQHAFKGGSGIVMTVVAIASLVLTAAGLFSQLRTALDIIWEAPPQRDKGWGAAVWSQVSAVLMVVVAGILLLATVLLSTFVTALHTRLAPMLPAMASPLWHVPQLLVTFGTTAALFALMFSTLPSVHIHKRDAWMAGAFTAVLFTLGELAIGAYLAIAAPGSVYGAAGSLLVVMVWAYYSAQVFYFGAELMKVSARRAGRYVAPEPAKPPVPSGFADRAQSISSRWLRSRSSSKR